MTLSIPSNSKNNEIELADSAGERLCRVAVAVSTPARMRGLLGCSGLPVGEGLLIRPCGAIHTLGMRFALDVIFFDRAWRILRVVKNVSPGRFWVGGGWHACQVLELAAGDAAADRFVVGTTVSPRPISSDAGD